MADIRFCPLCEETMEHPVCPTDGVPTVRSETLERSDDDDPVLGKVFSKRYRIDKQLGIGGMGRVYVATQLSIGREVALKTLLPHLVSDKTHLRRFFQEARAASKLSSPHVVQIYDFGIDDETGAPYIAMELLTGKGLYDLVKDTGGLSPQRAAGIAGQIAKALFAAAHEGIVHRDLKPANIFLVNTADGADFVKVMDFGIAKILRSDTDSMPSLTGTAMTVGTPSYMAPEQALCEDIDYRTDLYALGCIIHDLLLGAPPFEGSDPLRVMMSHVASSIPELPATAHGGEPVPDDLNYVYRRLMAKRRRDRPQSIRNIIDVLTAISNGQSVDAEAMLASEEGGGDGTSRIDGFPADFDGSSGGKITGAAAISDTEFAPGIQDTRDLRRGTVTPPPKRKAPLALAAVAAALVGVAIYWGMSQEARPPPAASPTGATISAAKKAPAELVAATPAAPGKQAVEADASPASPKAAPQAVVKKEYVVNSTPGARVVRDGKIVGDTPYTLSLAADAGPVQLELWSEGFKTTRLTVSPASPAKQTVTMGRLELAKPVAKKKRRTQTKPKTKPPPKKKKKDLAPW